MADAEELPVDLPEAIGDHAVRGLRRRDEVGLLLEAEDEAGRPVLLRTLGARWKLSKAAQKRFRELCSGMRRAAHGGIAPVADIGEHEGLPYCVLDVGDARCLDDLLEEMLDTTGARRPEEGRRLGEILTGRRIDAAFEELWGGSWFDMSADLVLQAAHALGHAHRSGLVHGDLGPQHVLLDDKARLRLFDFGLGQLGSTSVEGEAGGRLASPQFLAPEQCDGAPPGPQSDVWGLGVLLYRLITGRLPFPGNDPERVAQAVRSEEPPLPWRVDGKVPRALGAIAWKCLRKDPARRYAGMAELAADLERFFAEEPVTARVPGPLSRGLAYLRKHPLRVLPVPAAVALLVALVALPGSEDGGGEHGARSTTGSGGGGAGRGGGGDGGTGKQAPSGGAASTSLAEAVARLIERARGHAQRSGPVKVLFVGVEDRGGFGARKLAEVEAGLRFPSFVELAGPQRAERLLQDRGWQCEDLWSAAALDELARGDGIAVDAVLTGVLTRDPEGRALLSLQLYDGASDRVDREGLHLDGEGPAREGFDRRIVQAVEDLARRCAGIAGRGCLVVLPLEGAEGPLRAHAQEVCESALLKLRPSRFVPARRTLRLAARRALGLDAVAGKDGALALSLELDGRIAWIVGGRVDEAGVVLWAVDAATGERH